MKIKRIGEHFSAPSVLRMRIRRTELKRAKIGKMKIFVKVKIRAKREGVEKIDSENFVVSVKEIPEKGKANKAIIKILAEYFKIAPSMIKILTGGKSRQKTVE